jgi:hypothetical protein
LQHEKIKILTNKKNCPNRGGHLNMKRNIICVFLLVLGFRLLGQDVLYKLSFTINGEKQELKNNFTLYFVHVKDGEKIIYVPKIQNDTFYLSNILSEGRKPSMEKTFYYWILKYKRKIYIIHYGVLRFYEDPVDLEIVFETVSHDKFDKNKWTGSYSPTNLENIQEYQGIIHISWTIPAIGILATQKLIDLKYYFKEGKELLSLPTHGKKKGCCTKSKRKVDTNPNGWGIWE